jgi:hypothetical protein
VDLSDICDAQHSERTRHFLRQLGGESEVWAMVPMDHRTEYCRLAESMATAEMLDEIHTMLRALLKLPMMFNGKENK